MDKTYLKSRSEIKKLEREDKIDHIFTADSGEITHYGTKGNPSAIMSIWWDDYGQEYLIVDHPNPISKEAFEARKIFFSETKPKDKNNGT